MSLIPTKTPSVVKKMFPKYVWSISTTEAVIYLTFDDGPTPEITEWTLQQLKKFHAKATFFCIGNNVEKYPVVFQKIINHGHAIGNHTHNHLKGWKTQTNDYLENASKAQQVINYQLSIANSQASSVNLFRPPYGRIKPKQAKQLQALGYQIIMWDVLSFDWDKDVTSEKCLENVIKNTEKGSIIVFHDSLKASKNMMNTLPKVLDYYSKLGFTFKSLDFTGIV
ncbi:MAG: polysaccharide deacetylase family protein [Flavobacteriaceae bacterium]|nr:polysaccharide deacetylase family protein [Flavobacteriaceae bacterium]